MAKIDINEIAKNPKLSLRITSISDEHPKDACIRRCKDMVLFSVALFLILCVFFFCLYVLMNSNFSADDKKWSTVVIFSIISSLLGYLTGKNINS